RRPRARADSRAGRPAARSRERPERGRQPGRPVADQSCMPTAHARTRAANGGRGLAGLAAGLLVALSLGVAHAPARAGRRDEAPRHARPRGVEGRRAADAPPTGEGAITKALGGSTSLFRRYSYGKLGLSWTIVDAARAYPAGGDCSYDPRAAIELVDPKVDL